MAITDINISEQLQTDAPSIKYTGNEGPQNPQQQQEMMIAQQIWEALGPEQQGQFQSFEQFFQSGIWKQILQQMQQDEAQGPETQQGIGSLGPEPMQQQMPMPNRMGAEYGGRIGYQGGEMVEKIKEGIIAGGDRATGIPGIGKSAIENAVEWVMKESAKNGEFISYQEALERVLPQFRKPRNPRGPREEITQEEIIEQLGPRNPGFTRPTPDWDRDPGFIRPTPDWDRDPGFIRPPRRTRPQEEIEEIGIESLRGGI